MATLRTPLFGQVDQNLTPDQLTQMRVADMSSLRRGYEAGRTGTDINYNNAQVAGLRADGSAQAVAEADALDAQNATLQRKQALYAPEVGRVEDINGVGDAMSWAAGQVGQGAASMADPLAAGVALQGAGNLMSRGPGMFKAGGALLKGAGYAVPFATNQRQMTGEAYGAMTQDAELMARTSAQEREMNANLYGAAAGALDTVVPGMIAGKLAGGGLRQGIAKSGLGARTLGGMGMEGMTELGQQAGQQQVLGYMNPDRDTSGDSSDNLNAFVGGAIGSGPMVMAGEMADSGYRRVGDTAQRVSEKAGETVDLLAEKAGPAATAAKTKLGKVVGLFEGGAKDAAGKAQSAVADFETHLDERDIISGMPPDSVDANDKEAFASWYSEAAPKRMEVVADRLGKLADQGDEQAAAIYDGLTSEDDAARTEALEAGADHIMQQTEWAELERQAGERAKQAGRLATRFGSLAARAGKAAGGAAMSFGKAVIAGAKEGAKKNAQVDPFEQVLADQALDGGKRHIEAMKQEAAQAKSYQRAMLMSEYLASEAKSAAEGRGYSQSVEGAINIAPSMADRTGGTRMPKGSPEVMTGFMRDMGLEIADLAENWHATPKREPQANAPVGPISTLKNPADSKGQQYDGLKLSMNRIVRSMKLAYGERAAQVLDELQSIDQNSAPELFDFMRDELATQMSPRATRHNAEVEREAQNAVIGALGQDTEARLLKEGVNVRTGDGKKQLMSMVQAVDDGIAPPAAVRALENLVGKEQLLAMRRTIRPKQASREDLVDDGGVTNGVGVDVNDDGEVELRDRSNFDKALGETKVDKMRGPRMVRFGKSSLKLDQGARGDVFAADGRMSATRRKEVEDEFLQRVAAGERMDLPRAMQRPVLVKKGDKFHSGEDAVEGGLTRLEAEVGVDLSPKAMLDSLRRDAAAARKAGDRSEFDRVVAQGKGVAARLEAKDPALADEARQFFTDRSESGKWKARSVSVANYMAEEGFDPARILSLHRDYLRQDLAASADRMTPAQRTEALSEIRAVGVALMDTIDQADGKSGGLRLSPGERKAAHNAAAAYFGERYMAVAEQMTDAVPEQLSAGEIKVMSDLGARIEDLARKQPNEAAKNEAVSAANILVFKGKGKNKAGEQVAVRIPAKELAKWGKAQRDTYDSGTAEQGRKAEKTERFGDTDKDMQFLRDLSLGITALMDSGVVDTGVMPYKLNKFGKAEHFTKVSGTSLDGLPPSLALATTTVFGLQAKAEIRQAHRKEPSQSEQRRKRLTDTKDKLKEWTDEFFVAGNEEVNPNAGAEADADAVFKDVRSRTKSVARDARTMPLPQNEVVLTAAAFAQQRADAIVRNFMPQERNEKLEAKVVGGVPKAVAGERFAEGVSAIKQRLRVARQDKKDGGGAQYAIPVVVALTDDNIARMDVTAEEAKDLKLLRMSALRIIDESTLNKTLKTKFGSAAPEVGASLGKPSGVGKAAGTKFNRQSEDIHTSLGRDGFAATHDSPVRHEGKFDWRAHAGKGEGNAAFGAGTYLSTADGVHASYKDQFTAMSEERSGDPELLRLNHEAFDAASKALAKFGKKSVEYQAAEQARMEAERAYLDSEFVTRTISPTYQVSVDIKPEQLLDWDKPLSEQSAVVQKRLLGAMQDKGITADPWAEDWDSFGAEVSDGTSITIMAEGDDNYVNHGGEIVGNFRTVELAKKAAEDHLKSLGLRTVTQNTGAEVYRGLTNGLGSQAKASDYLQSLGILGHRYNAAGGKNDTHPNYVIYDDSKITTNYVHFNKQGKNTPESTQAERDAATAEIIKTLGKDIDVRFEQTTGFSGAYLDKEAAIVISMTPAAGTLQTAYHEALHAFVARLVKGNAKAERVLNSLANHQPTLERVHALLDGFPAAQAQLADGEERIAFIYQFWRAGLLDLPASPGTGMLQKLRKFFRGILGRVSDLERSGDLLAAFAAGSYAGDVSVAGKVMAKTLSEGTWGPRTMRKMDAVAQRLAAWTVPSQSLLLMSDSPTAQKLGNVFWTNPGDEDAGAVKEGYLNARERMAKRYTNEFSRIVNGFTERDHKDVAKYLQAEVDASTIAYQPHREAVEKIRGLLQRFRKYMVEERGMKIGDRGPLYFPRMWSPHRMAAKKAEFLKMMAANHPTYDAEAVYNAIVTKFEQNTEDSQHGRENEDAVLKPAHGAGDERILAFITGEQAQPFLEDSLVGALSRYFHEGARAAEYTARFGQTGKRLEKALAMIHTELRAAGKKRRDDGELSDQDAETKWVARQLRDVTNAVDAMEGTLGSDISDAWRKTNSWVTVYQNVRLLPMALFSSIVDPLGMLARGATMRDAYDGFLRGMSEVVKNWGEMATGKTKEREIDKWERLAMAVGSVDAAVFNHHVSDEYASVFMSAGAKKINDFMFKANGMEAWNRGMRVAATRAAALFILRHKGLPDTHSKRWLTEIGLKPADIHVDTDGELVTNKHVLAAQLGIDVDEAAKQVEKVHYAINRWVQGAVLTPNAAQRPAWGSDPHYSMFFHLKQFAYSFHQTILKRAVNEMNYGNLAPMGAFVWYIPVMIASDITKGLIQGGGELPSHMKGMDLGDWVAHGAERSGMLGVGQMGVDASSDLASIGGPAVEQIIDAYSDPLERTMIKAAPAHGLYAEILK